MSRRISALFSITPVPNTQKVPFAARKAAASFPAPAITYQQCDRVLGQ
jgi:hypothetical protein